MSYMTRALAHSDPRFAEILRRLGHAEDAATPEAKEEAPAPKPPKAKKKAAKRAYKRRDMQAEEE